eukprot:1659700-Prorocentrum_lima.AAC.1
MAEAQAHMRDIMEHTVQNAMAQPPHMLAATIASAVPPVPPGATVGQRLPQETPLPASPQAALED